MKWIYYISIISLLVFSCTTKPSSNPTEIIPEETKSDIVVDESLSIGSETDSAQTIRITCFSLKKIGPTMFKDKPGKFELVATLLAEYAELGIVVFDEYQNKTQTYVEVFKSAIYDKSDANLRCELSDLVDESISDSDEQFGFIWNQDLLQMTTDIKIYYHDGIKRDPAYVSFKCIPDGFDFTICSFHTRPDSEEVKLRNELMVLDDIYEEIQSQDPLENDIIFIGDFNAPPNIWNEQTDETLTIGYYFEPSVYDLTFLIVDQSTNLKGYNKKKARLYDNIFFLSDETDEYVSGSGTVIDFYQTGELDDYYNYIGSDEDLTLEEIADKMSTKALDHYPVYGEFYSQIDTY